MATLLTEPIYNEIRKIRETLVQEFGVDNVSGIHLPWAGNKVHHSKQLARVLYVVGIATAAHYPSDLARNFDEAKNYCNEEWQKEAKERRNTPFWQFVTGLTKFIYGKPHYECIEDWGWSNIFKVAYNDNELGPSAWPNGFLDTQRDVCAQALNYEFSQLRNAAIFIGWHDAEQMLERVLPVAKWDKTSESDAIYFWKDSSTANLYIWGDHPKGARLHHRFDQMLTRTQSLIASCLV